MSTILSAFVSIHYKSLTFSVLKVLTESLRLKYALLVWGPPLKTDQITRLQWMPSMLQSCCVNMIKERHYS